jgi:hypothetical protein
MGWGRIFYSCHAAARYGWLAHDILARRRGSHKRHRSATGPISQRQAHSELKLPPFVEVALWKGMVLPQPSNRPKWFS